MTPHSLLWHPARCSVVSAPELCGVLISVPLHHLYHVMSLGEEAVMERRATMGMGMPLCPEVGERKDEVGPKIRRYRIGYSEEFVEAQVLYEQ
jgi:hypothetical protein